MKISFSCLLLLLCCSSLHAAQARQSYTEKYGVIETRNVFVKDRAHIVIGATSRPSSENSRRSPEESLILTGIVEEGGGFRAYVENLDSSGILRVAVGDSLHKGKVGAIEPDAIAYDPTGGQRIWVEVGSDLTGKPSAALAARAAEEQSNPSVSADLGNINPNDPNLTIEQKMKLRRAQQLGTPLTPAAAPAAAGGAPAAPGAATQPAPGATPPPPNGQPQPQPIQQQQLQPPTQVIPVPVPQEAFEQSNQ
jgi:hypothetical protein